MKIKPLGERVLLKKEDKQEKTEGGLYIPETAQKKTWTGLVVALGEDRDVIKVKVGEKVMYERYAGVELEVDGSEHLLMKMSDIIAIVE